MNQALALTDGQRAALTEEQAAAIDAAKVKQNNRQALEERGLGENDWRILKEVIFPDAEPASIYMAIDYCISRNLDVLKKPVHIVPVWSNKHRRKIQTVWPSILEMRITATRTKEYAGADATEFGPMKKMTFTGPMKHGEPSKEFTRDLPEWAQITLYRDVKGKRRKFVGPKIWFIEAYAAATREPVANGLAMPNEMWRRRAIGQLEKCAEAAALRKAFPEEVGSDYSAEEMQGQTIDLDDYEITQSEKSPKDRPKLADFKKEIEEDEPDNAPIEELPEPEEQSPFLMWDQIGEEMPEMMPEDWMETFFTMIESDKLSDDEKRQFIVNNYEQARCVILTGATSFNSRSLLMELESMGFPVGDLDFGGS